MRRERVLGSDSRSEGLGEFSRTSEPPDFDQTPILEGQIDTVIPDLWVYYQLPLIAGSRGVAGFVERHCTGTMAHFNLMNRSGTLHGSGSIDGLLDGLPNGEAVRVAFSDSLVEKAKEFTGTQEEYRGDQGEGEWDIHGRWLMPPNRLVACTSAGFIADSLSQKHTQINHVLSRRALYF
jgi:hypothetical protein